VVGCSKTSLLKQEHFRQIVDALLYNYSQTETNYDYFMYIDTNAGPGFHPIYEKGSPIIFLEEIAKFGLKYNSILFERDKEEVVELRKSLIKYNNGFIDENIAVLKKDNHVLSEDLIKSYIKVSHDKPIHGLIYADPNGFSSFDILSQFSHIPVFNNVNVLISCPCCSIKRLINKRIKQGITDTPRLKEYINNINRKHWFVREPKGNFQWTFLLGTNDDNLDVPEFSVLHNLNTQKGIETFNKLHYTKEELYALRKELINSSLRIPL
jgi:three-Cys-motif partner protein